MSEPWKCTSTTVIEFFGELHPARASTYNTKLDMIDDMWIPREKALAIVEFLRELRLDLTS